MKQIELKDTKLFEKQVLRLGNWKHASAPNGVLSITKEYIQKIADNFKKNPFVPVYRGHVSDEEAAKNPNLIIAKNIKEFEVKDDGLYAKLEVPEDEVETYADVSLSIDPDYEDHEKGEKIGATARHLAFVPSPFIKQLQPFTALGEKHDYSILLSEINMDDKQTTAKAETEEVETTPVVEDVEKKEEEAQPETKTETTETDKVETDKVNAEVIEPIKAETIDNAESSEDIRVQLAEAQKEIKSLRDKTRAQEAEKDYSDLLHRGKILPTMKDAFIQLSQVGSNTIDLADGKTTTVNTLIKEIFEKLPTLVNLKENGVNVELGDSTSTSLVADMEKSYFIRNPKATKEDFKKYVLDNSRIIEEESKKIKK